MDIPSPWREILDFFIMYVVVRGVFAHWLSAYIAKLISKLAHTLIIKTEQEIALYREYLEKSSTKG